MATTPEKVSRSASTLMFVYFSLMLFATADSLIMTPKQVLLYFVSIPVWLLLGLKGLFQCGQRALSSKHTLLRGLGCSPSDHAPVASVLWHLSEATHAKVQLNHTNSNTRTPPKLHACMHACWKKQTCRAHTYHVTTQSTNHKHNCYNFGVLNMEFYCTDSVPTHSRRVLPELTVHSQNTPKLSKTD